LRSVRLRRRPGARRLWCAPHAHLGQRLLVGESSVLEQVEAGERVRELTPGSRRHPRLVERAEDARGPPVVGDGIVMASQRQQGSAAHEADVCALEPGLVAELALCAGRVLQGPLRVAEQQRGAGQLRLAVGDVCCGPHIAQGCVGSAKHVASLVGLRR
jgi:hypothetical protein